MPKFTDLISSLPDTIPFVAPEEMERNRGAVFDARIGANENSFGPSAAALEAMRQAGSSIWKYGDPTSHELREALSARHRVPAEAIRVGEGIDGLLGITVRLLIAPGDAVVTSDGAYPTFNYHVAGFGGVIHEVPYANDREDPEALAARAHEVGAKIVYLANPDNPMGTWRSAAAIRRMLKSLPEDCALCLDEAYIEFAPPGVAPPMDLSDPRLFRFRTFSKAYGMAGLRIGYVIGAPEMVAGLDRIRNHFGVNRLAQVAALAALEDDEHLPRVQARTAHAREEITLIAAKNGLTALPSATNFVAIDCGGDGARARGVVKALGERGVFVRMPGVAPLDRCIRVTCGLPRDLTLFAQALPDSLQDQGADRSATVVPLTFPREMRAGDDQNGQES